MTADDRTVTFTWAEAFVAGGMFKSNKKALSDGNLEAACVMFNLGALHAQIAKATSLTDVRRLLWLLLLRLLPSAVFRVVRCA